MAEMRQDPRSRRIAVLEAEVAELRAKLEKYQSLGTAGQHELVELGLRLSQENEALRKELAALKSSGKAKD
jgi:hypothetical protein